MFRPAATSYLALVSFPPLPCLCVSISLNRSCLHSLLVAGVLLQSPESSSRSSQPFPALLLAVRRHPLESGTGAARSTQVQHARARRRQIRCNEDRPARLPTPGSSSSPFGSVEFRLKNTSKAPSCEPGEYNSRFRNHIVDHLSYTKLFESNRSSSIGTVE